MPYATVKTDSGLASQLRISVMRLGRRLRLERTDDSMSLNQLAVMGTLDRHGSMSIGELAAHEKVRPPRSRARSGASRTSATSGAYRVRRTAARSSSS